MYVIISYAYNKSCCIAPGSQLPHAQLPVHRIPLINTGNARGAAVIAHRAMIGNAGELQDDVGKMITSYDMCSQCRHMWGKVRWALN